ncbi:hypothetical protein PVK06_004871 [Gossypium arboreum]|uniref:Uncharacterized protein n=1 Tax=Gossypium arboreum TaxID=29729 RepID=A0ABR0QTL2_GOSAR|nr:hypothetical protein PVK06_004871 [Gossypium arboreum]
MGSMVIGDWSGIFEELLGKVVATTRQLERSGSTQLGINCVDDIVPRDVSGDATTKN